MRAAFRMLVGGVVLLAACQDVNEPTGPSADSPQFAKAGMGLAGGSAEDVAIAREVPEFGGVFVDGAGRPTAYVTDAAAAPELRARLADFAEDRGFSPGDIVLLPARHSFAQLSDAFERATHAAMPLVGSVFTDLDETRNLVVVGVENRGYETAVRQALSRAGLRPDMYDVVVTPAIHQAATLRDRFDPTQGGIQIHFTQYVCTLGANVLDGTQRSFLTNSHCTATQGGVENTVYYQPTSSVDGTVIATEVEDPQYFKGGVCPRGKKCRYSDSSRALYAAARGSSLGVMTKTTGVNSGSLEVSGTFNITGKDYSVAAGESVNKVGRTTGWTQANISRTCVNTGVQGSQVLQLCQHWVQSNNATIVAGGDSGSTVWQGSSSISIVGLLWGGSSDNRTFIFSPIGQVEQELGTLSFN